MKNLLLIVSLSFLLNTNALATNDALVLTKPIHISQANKCISVKTSCSSGNGTCITQYCGDKARELELEKKRSQKLNIEHIEKNKIREPQLAQFVIKHNLKGKKFSQLIELENYMKRNLPAELRTMTIEFSYKKREHTNYNPNRIIILLDESSYILDLIIS